MTLCLPRTNAGWPLPAKWIALASDRGETGSDEGGWKRPGSDPSPGPRPGWQSAGGEPPSPLGEENGSARACAQPSHRLPFSLRRSDEKYNLPVGLDAGSGGRTCPRGGASGAGSGYRCQRDETCGAGPLQIQHRSAGRAPAGGQERKDQECGDSQRRGVSHQLSRPRREQHHASGESWRIRSGRARWT